MTDPVKITLWGCPRTCSLSFLKCMSKIPDIQIIFELFTTAYHFGPERDITVHNTFPKEPDIETKVGETGILETESRSGFHSSVCTYEFCKKQLEADYPGKKLIFSKENAAYLIPKYGYLPNGYRHVFLIRDPNKVFPHWKRIVQEIRIVKHGEIIAYNDLILDRQPADVMPAGFGFKEAYELYQYIKEKKLGPDPIVLDAGDLVDNPKAVLTAFCGMVGVPYSDDMLSWEKGFALTEDWVMSQRHKYIMMNAKTCENFRNGTGFFKPSPSDDNPEVTADVQRCIDFSMPYYKKMYEDRLKF